MVIVIIAGGSGTRLWPLSSGNHPKHLLSLTGETSLLQNTYRRASLITSDIYVVPETSHADAVRDQLPELTEDHLVIEPGRRGTASCVVLALARIKQHLAPDVPVIFLHADYHILNEDGFARTVRAAVAAATQHHAIGLIGLRPSYPATGFGYIETADKLPNENSMPVFSVQSFKEKPTLNVAEGYLEAGRYLWNLGLFVATLAQWRTEFAAKSPVYSVALDKLSKIDDPAKISEIYLELPNKPIDTALIEKADHLVVVPGDFDWADIGSFFDLHKILRGLDGNALAGNVNMIDCEDSMIHGTNKPIIAIGLSGVIVVDTPDGLLVCAKEQSQLVGELAKKLLD